MANKKYGADIVTDSLVNHGVDLVFGIPGAKIDRLFETLEHPAEGQRVPKLVVARHEQNAAFMAQAFARITGKTGVVIATSGPGVGNLATGLMTATAESDPIVAIGGQVPRNDLYRLTHQSTNSVALFSPITNLASEIQDPNNISEIIANAFAAANGAKKGATFVSLPQDVDDAQVTIEALPKITPAQQGAAAIKDIDWLAEQIKAAKLPVLLVGSRGSDDATVTALHQLLKQTTLPVVETFQGAGVISRELEPETFFGRIGLFRNQTGDKLLKQSDLVITLGYDAIEYEPRNWNKENTLNIVALDTTPVQIDNNFVPQRQLVGDLAQSLRLLIERLNGYELPTTSKEVLKKLKADLRASDEPSYTPAQGNLNHPLDVIKSIQAHVTDDMTVSTDIGSHYIWMARHFKSYVARHYLISNGMQTLGVGLPWALAAAMVRPNAKSVSVSGDGGFFFSAMELETAVRLGLNTVHIVWNDNAYYDMVKFQEEMKYNGQSAGVKFGNIDLVKYAESFGAKGLRVETPDDLDTVLDEAFSTQGPVVVDIPVDYSHNYELGSQLIGSEG
ncbi:acetolactate synthase AlsS [Leuconostoc mesenteroides]|uniref:Acetolactate synthase n=1 Tax=Leuconostoc mesenteroides subsp. mesenteroides (strain ATCC 8293 / DSM 20343 / BCRC 11652 / CCM 1803 / JCM 6124 / NCDO 523 / NBRC 100496 / NCIMB 8023 / NCTC 12954 / NRRL B-1118 / 37Y) TaxID=203120 RepID=Q03YT5_LEUMM|nr:acetolactate synthase AlsS [Leuconostoc mesenteroides]ABJ61637.1 Acetolactate synthase [Leuconostoc mesenteroides subsp. mesenteroides ATCC 8293]MCT3042002.1 acetolactate synthase AlsS [Leuconostoc mesenteroides]MCT3045365.1 acetolactate synthase AlsS [Leuconostoc mesenteroides]MCU4665347.1 acetolactate synthase AlsS [Leuconostoc mesenteroides]MDG9745879.1 acetolactate synthase AlsS [Leuconostoc mesenteroides]